MMKRIISMTGVSHGSNPLRIFTIGLKHKDKFLSLQVDVTATPKHNNGSIFVQTISDYPLVEAISQNVVKHPVLPDAASRAKLVNGKVQNIPKNMLTISTWALMNGARLTLNMKSWIKKPFCLS